MREVQVREVQGMGGLKPEEECGGYGQDQRIDQDRILVIRPDWCRWGRSCPNNPIP